MSDRGLVVVHRAAPEVADGFAERLRAAGLEAIALDQPTFLVLLVTFGTYRVRIAVPAEEETEAKRVMAEWDRESAPLVRDLTRTLRRQALLALIPVVFAAVFLPFLAAGWDLVPWIACALPAVYLLSFLALAVLARQEG